MIGRQTRITDQWKVQTGTCSSSLRQPDVTCSLKAVSAAGDGNLQPSQTTAPLLRPHPGEMKCLNNRADSHLTGQVECEMEGAGKGAWVNHGFCSTSPPVPGGVSTIYNSQPHLQGSVEGMYKLEPLVTFPEATASSEQNLLKKRRGCCSFIKGKKNLRYCFTISSGWTCRGIKTIHKKMCF